MLIEPPVLSSSASLPSCTPVIGLGAADMTIPSRVVTQIDFAQEQYVIPSCQQNQVGLVVDVPLKDSLGGPVNLTGATEIFAWLRPPSGASKRKGAVPRGEPSLGVARYTSEPADLHQHGVWAIQISATLASGLKVLSRVELFRVEPNVGPYAPTTIAPQLTGAMTMLEPTIVFS